MDKTNGNLANDVPWDNGEPPPPAEEKRKRKKVVAPPDDDEKPVKLARISESQLMEVFVDKYGDDWRYVDKWGKWFYWNGKIWAEDNERVINDRVRKFCTRNGEGSGRTASAVLNFLKADEKKIAASVDQWDTDIWLLGTPNGTFDLRTSKMRPPRREDYMTMTTAVAPKKMMTPLWFGYLNTVTDANNALRDYMQRMAGYCLTGSTKEHAMFFLHGDGGRGKGVKINTLSGILGDYAKTVPIATFMASKHEQHLTHLAGLKGARLVFTDEVEEGRRWAEAKIKWITGGGVISAHFMHKDPFRYKPHFKLAISGNYKPKLSSVNNAMRRRFNLIPFKVVIKEADLDLEDNLKAEWPGILHWMIEGCRAWQKEKLNPPSIVIEATNDYFEDQDTLKQWLEECCVVVDGYDDATADVKVRTGRAAMFKSWDAWASINNINWSGTQTTFNEAMEKKGIGRKDTNGARDFLGVRFKTQEDIDAERKAQAEAGAA